MYDIDKLKKELKDRLSEKRYNHSVNVANECRKLAEHYEADVEKAYFAGLVHDICKELPVEELKMAAVNSNLGMVDAELKTKALWHAVAGAGYVRDVMNINDMDIINAVRFHTIARAGMSKIEEIVYIGDLISEDRDYKEVKKMRKLAYQNIDRTMFEAIIFSIESVMEKKGLIPEYTLQAYNQYAYIVGKRSQDGK